jgi:hypothetical protein
VPESFPRGCLALVVIFTPPVPELARAAKAGEVEERRLARDEVADERRVSKPR